MLLVAYLDRRGVRHRALRPSERGLLGPMIRVSDNDAASAIYARVGERNRPIYLKRDWPPRECTAGDCGDTDLQIRGPTPRRRSSPKPYPLLPILAFQQRK